MLKILNALNVQIIVKYVKLRVVLIAQISTFWIAKLYNVALTANIADLI